MIDYAMGDGAVGEHLTLQQIVAPRQAVVTPPAATVTGVMVSPASASLNGGATQQFSATVSGTNSPSQAVTWTASAGSINSAGVFTAPAATTSTQTVTVTATSVADNSKAGQATITVAAQSAQLPTVTGIMVSPTGFSLDGGATQQFTATVVGTNNPSQQVIWQASMGSIDANGLYTAPPSTSIQQTVTITVTSTQDGTKKTTIAGTIKVATKPPEQVPTVSQVVVSPQAWTLLGGGVKAFTAQVLGANSPSQAVTWDTNLGSVSSNGVYTAPQSTATKQLATITATSVLDPSKSVSAVVTILETSGQVGSGTVAVTVLARDQNGNTMAGAYIECILNMVDVDDLRGYIAPELITTQADSDGRAVLNLWPNVLGSRGSKYIVTINNPDTGEDMAVEISVPNEDCYLHQYGTLVS